MTWLCYTDSGCSSLRTDCMCPWNFETGYCGAVPEVTRWTIANCQTIAYSRSRPTRELGLPGPRGWTIVYPRAHPAIASLVLASYTLGVTMGLKTLRAGPRNTLRPPGFHGELQHSQDPSNWSQDHLGRWKKPRGMSASLYLA